MGKADKYKKNISIRLSIIILFVVLISITVAIIGYIVFSNWLKSADVTMTQIAEGINDEIFIRVDDFIKTPLHISESNHELIEKGIVDINNEEEREIFFVSVLQSYDAGYLYSFSYGTENGEYYGARRNESNEVEIMRNNASTNGHSLYFSVTDEMTAKEIAIDAGKFDPRTRDWYITAKENKQKAFSKAYVHFVKKDLAISAVSPIYGVDGTLEGVLGTHITLSIINNYLKEIVKNNNAMAVIVEKNSGELIANSLDSNNFNTAQDGSVERLTINDIDNQAIIQAYNSYKNSGESNLKIKNGNSYLYINIRENRKESLDWIVITAMPNTLFIANIINSMKMAGILIVLAFIVSLVIYMKFTNKLFKPMYNLIETAGKFSKGDLRQRAVLVRNDELGSITKSFNEMADTVHELVNNLEGKVQERTLELDKTNNELVENINQIKYLNNHDSLTGLYNRMYYEDALNRLDTINNLPISIIFGDSNSLKITNDIFGHAAGDELLKKTAEIMKNTCRASDVVARVGGDEFAIILPKTTRSEAGMIVGRIKDGLSKEHIVAIKCSMSLGHDTKISMDQSLVKIMENAEDEMYDDKTINRKDVNSDTINTIIETLHSRSPWEKTHSIAVSELCYAIGLSMDLPEKTLRKLKQAGYLHDIGKITLRDDLLNEEELLTAADNKEMQQHPLAGFRILNSFDETMDLAESILSHHERWDGTGIPKGLKGKEIPAIARIINLAGTYNSMISPLKGKSLSKIEAIEEIKKQSGKKFDPEIVDHFIKLI